MSDNNNEAEALFATRRKKQQDEEAQKAARLAEEQRLAEIERQKQEVAQEIERLEKLQAQQKEQEEKQRLLDAQAKAGSEGKTVSGANNATSGNSSGSSSMKKYLPFILIGTGVLVVAVVVIIIVVSSSKSKDNLDNPDYYTYSDEGDEDYYDYDNSLSYWLTKVDWYRELDQSGVSYVYPSFFGKNEGEDADEFPYYYRDVNSYQYIKMAISPYVLDADDKSYATDGRMKMLLSAVLEGYGILDYQADSYGDNMWYACDSLDAVGWGGEMTVAISGINDTTGLDILFKVCHEDVGSKRTIDIEDLLYMASIMLEKLSVG